MESNSSHSQTCVDANLTHSIDSQGDTIYFTIPDSPIAQGRAKFASRGKHVHVYDPIKSAKWKKVVAFYASTAIANKEPNLFFFAHIPLLLVVHFIVPRPASHLTKTGKHTKAWKQFPTSKPDLSNFVKAIEDALNGVVYHDDSQIVSEYTHKRYADSIAPCVIVTISKANS